MVSLVLAMPGHAETWIELAEQQLYCARLATPQERSDLGVRFGQGRTADFWARKPANPAAALERYLLILGGLGYMADGANDQSLREQILLHAAITARKEARLNPAASRQLVRCAHAALIASNVERSNSTAQADLAASLVADYASESGPGRPIEDLPLIHALREAAVGAESSALDPLLTLVASRAQQLRDRDPPRASRLLAAAAEGYLGKRDAGRALAAATESMTVMATGRKRPPPDVAWRAFPLLVDATELKDGPNAARELSARLEAEIGTPPRDPDPAIQFRILLRLTALAEYRFVNTTGGTLADIQRLSRETVRSLYVEDHSVPWLRRGLMDLEFGGSGRQEQFEVWRRDPGIARRDYQEAYKPQLEQLLAQSQTTSIGDIRTQIIQQTKLDRWLSTMPVLAQVLPGDRSEITDLAFKGMQLRSHASVTAYTMKGYVRRSRGDARTRDQILRFLTMQADPSVMLGRALAKVYTAGYGGKGSWETTSEIFSVLDIYHTESSKAIVEFRRFIWDKAPDLRGLILGSPATVALARQLLRDDEVIIAIAPTETDIVLLGITRTEASLVRTPIGRRAVTDLVSRLRKSVLPAGGLENYSLPPFDAAAAHELYSATVTPLSRLVAGKRHVIWYSSGDLASLPPAMLVESKPPVPRSSDPKVLGALRWFGDGRAISVLPELPLLWVYRGLKPLPQQPYAFIGIGAPQLTLAEINGARQARSTVLAGGLDGRAIASLPKLPEAADELRNLASLMGTDKSALLLGPQASRAAAVDLLGKGATIISLATHGFVAHEIFGVSEPSLLMATPPESTDSRDSLLTARDIADIDLEASLLILSACNTATSDGRPRGASFTGLSQSFQAAGARSLLVSHWPVASLAATDLSVGVVQRAVDGRQPLATAVQDSMKDFRKQNPRLAHPFYWAPFVLVGDGATAVD